MAGSTVTLGKDNFQQTVEKTGIVLIDWWAEWCGPCRAFAPVYERVAQKNTDVVFGKINTEEQQELAMVFGIRSIPTVSIFRDGILLFNQPGMLPEKGLVEVLAKVRELDMEDVRKKLDEADKAEANQRAQ